MEKNISKEIFDNKLAKETILAILKITLVSPEKN